MLQNHLFYLYVFRGSITLLLIKKKIASKPSDQSSPNHDTYIYNNPFWLAHSIISRNASSTNCSKEIP